MPTTTYKYAQELPVRQFQETLEISSGKRLKVKINDNRSTMLSVRWEPDYTRVSLHRMFLQAPGNVMEALACYLKGEKRILSPAIKKFIEENIKKLDYSRTLDRSSLNAKGAVYDLQQISDEINDKYFNGQLRLFITWFTQSKTKNRSKITLGLYQDTLRLVKINRLLDSREVPLYLVKFVVYHEMLHAVCPPQVDDRGTSHIHSREFKRRESQFEYCQQGKKWIQDNRGALFDDPL